MQFLIDVQLSPCHFLFYFHPALNCAFFPGATVFNLLAICFYPIKKKDIHGLEKWFSLLEKYNLAKKFVSNAAFLHEYGSDDTFDGQWYLLGSFDFEEK